MVSSDSDPHPFRDLPTPAPEYGPGRAVDLQLEALAKNDEPVADAGIRTAYNFASPANRRHTGPYERFARMLRGQRYAPMIDHVEAVVGPVERSGTVATRRATITGPDGRTVTYRFRLSKVMAGEFGGCWQTDAVEVE